MLDVRSGNIIIGKLGLVTSKKLQGFSIKQPVYYANFSFDVINRLKKAPISFAPVSKFPSVHRDLSMVLPKSRQWKEIEEITETLKLGKLKSIKLFDIFEHEKLGEGNRSMAVHFTFLDPEKTLTDKETDAMMSKITRLYETELKAEVRKA